ncbi:MAG: OmpA family protein [Methylococcales bacterium]|nr:OmpA family protein [Methylococcales bacterium]
MRIKKTAITLALMATILSACSSTNNTDPGFIDNGVPDASIESYNAYGNNAVSDSGTAKYGSSLQETQSPKHTMGDNAATFAPETIYFMFDSSEVQSQFIPIINKYSDYLRANPNKIIVLEGHADERGSREYNIALGEERAKSVARIMEAGGVFRGQLEFVSYGEEKPASFGHNESAWRLNRRVNLIY